MKAFDGGFLYGNSGGECGNGYFGGVAWVCYGSVVGLCSGDCGSVWAGNRRLCCGDGVCNSSVGFGEGVSRRTHGGHIGRRLNRHNRRRQWASGVGGACGDGSYYDGGANVAGRGRFSGGGVFRA